MTNGTEDAVWQLDGNVLSRSVYARGDTDAALAASAHTVHEVFQTQRIEHAFLEPESTLAVPNGNGTMHVYSGGQGVWDDRDQIASVLAVDPQQITVELVSNGGAFGGKEDMANQAQTALGRPSVGPAGVVYLVAGGVAADAPQAPSPAHRGVGPGATPTASSPPCGPAWSAIPAPTPRWA